MRYTEVEIRPSYEQIVYWGRRTEYEYYLPFYNNDQTAVWLAEQRGEISLNPVSILMHTGRFIGGETLAPGEQGPTRPRTWQEGLDIFFDVGKRKDETEESGEVTIYNLSERVLHYIRTGCEIFIKSGYENHYDTIFSGYITKVQTRLDEGDQQTTITCKGLGKNVTDLKTSTVYFQGPDTFKTVLDKFFNKIGMSYVLVGISGQTKYNDLIVENTDKSLYVWGKYWNGSFFTYGYHWIWAFFGDGSSETVKEVLDSAAEQCGYKWTWTVINSRVYIIKKGWSLPAFCRLTPLTGLLEYQPAAEEVVKEEDSVDEEAAAAETDSYTTEQHYDISNLTITKREGIMDLYNVKSILIYDIVPHSLVVVQPTLTGDAYLLFVRECDYKSDESEHVVEFVAEKLGIFDKPWGFADIRQQSGAGYARIHDPTPFGVPAGF